MGLIPWLFGRFGAAREAEGALPPFVRVPRINADLCIGCEKCVAICPARVLELVNHKSAVLRQDDCISCQKCAEVCPTQALVMYKGGVEPTRTLQMPILDEYYQSRRIPGMYLIGQAAGTPLIKNGINLGRAVIEHMRLRGGLIPLCARPPRPARPDVEEVDVAIVGAGPAGLSAGMSCFQRGLSYVVLERADSAMSTVMRFPMSKHVDPVPHDVRCVGLLPVWQCTTPALRKEWNRIIDGVGLRVALQTSVEDIKREEAGGAFLVRTRDMRTNRPGRLYRAQRVVVAVGGLGNPNKLGGDRDLEGENLPHVHKVLDDADRHRGQRILVVGGGDSAVESAVDLARPALGNRVILAYYKKENNLRCNPKNLGRLRQAVAEDRLLVLYESRVISFSPGKVVLEVARPGASPPVRRREIEIDHVFVLIGGTPPQKWLERIRFEYDDQVPHDGFRRPPTDKLVEDLIGPQPDNRRPNRPLPVADAAAVDRARIRPEAAPSEETIKAAAAHLCFRLPPRAQIDGPARTVREVVSEMTMPEMMKGKKL